MIARDATQRRWPANPDRLAIYFDDPTEPAKGIDHHVGVFRVKDTVDLTPSIGLGSEGSKDQRPIGDALGAGDLHDGSRWPSDRFDGKKGGINGFSRHKSRA